MGRLCRFGNRKRLLGSAATEEYDGRLQSARCPVWDRLDNGRAEGVNGSMNMNHSESLAPHTGKIFEAISRMECIKPFTPYPGVLAPLVPSVAER